MRSSLIKTLISFMRPVRRIATIADRPIIRRIKAPPSYLNHRHFDPVKPLEIGEPPVATLPTTYVNDILKPTLQCAKNRSKCPKPKGKCKPKPSHCRHPWAKCPKKCPQPSPKCPTDCGVCDKACDPLRGTRRGEDGKRRKKQAATQGKQNLGKTAGPKKCCR